MSLKNNVQNIETYNIAVGSEESEVEFSVDGYLPPDENGESSVENLEYENEFKVSWGSVRHSWRWN